MRSLVAEGFARMVRSTRNGHLERALAGPVRRVVLDAIFRQMPRHFDGTAAGNLDAVIRWCIGRGGGSDAPDVYELEIRDGRCRAWRGENGREPRVTITLQAAEFVRLATGNSDPMKAYFTGRVALGGDIMLAAKLQSLFRIPGRGALGQRVRTMSSSR